MTDLRSRLKAFRVPGLRRPPNPLQVHLDRAEVCGDTLVLEGWAYDRRSPLTRTVVRVGEVAVPIADWRDREDVRRDRPGDPVPRACGFCVRLPLHGQEPPARVRVEGESDRGASDTWLTLPPLQRPVSDPPPLPDGGDLTVQIERTWSDDGAVGLKGWAFRKTGAPLKTLRVRWGDVVVPVESWHDRPDVAAAYPAARVVQPCGFWVQVPRRARHAFALEAEGPDGQVQTVAADLEALPPPPPAIAPSGGQILVEFVHRVNASQRSVLEIGSRVVSPGSSTKRPWFAEGAESYTGFDYYPDDNTDIVGDAHRLSSYLGGRKFGAIFSLSVFEHLAMPWLVAAEINKSLDIGGLTFHATHSAWPVHEYPWDFWRFTDRGLAVLFSPALGFEVLEAGMFNPVRMHFDSPIPGQEGMPHQLNFGGSAILARKVAEIDPERFRWEATTEAVTSGTHYPKPSGS